MKKIILTAMLFASVGSFAAVSAFANNQVEVTENAETPVKVEELPEAITKTLSTDTYAEWKIDTAFLVKEGENEYYKVNVVKGDEKQTMKFNKDGSVIAG